MLSDFKPAYNILRSLEGYYSNIKGDAETYAGINRRYYPDARIWYYVDKEKPLQNGQKLKNERAESIVEVFYYTAYWLKYTLSRITYQPTATFLLCQIVNRGVEAIKTAQQAAGMGVGDIDGILGPKTIEALNNDPEPHNTLIAMGDIARQKYRDIVASNPEKKKFLAGWLNRVNTLMS